MHWSADQKPLSKVAVAAPEELELRQCFDALGGDFNIESPRHRNGGPNDTLVAVVIPDISD